MARIDYESTVAPTSIDVGAGNLGKRSGDGVFSEAYRVPEGSDEARTGATRATSGDRERLLTTARTVLSTYEGGNQMFPEYRRNFIPGSTDAAGTSVTAGLDDIYLQPRNKTGLDLETLKLGTPYSPTVASPGPQNKLNPEGLRPVASTVNGVVYTGGTDPLSQQLDPDTEMHRNRDAAGSVNNVGQVRRFKLGVASSTTTTMDATNSRGQFPNVT